MNEQSTISSLKGIGEKTEKLFQKLNIFTIGDLLRHFPKGYEVYEEATPIAEIDEGRTVTVTGAGKYRSLAEQVCRLQPFM